MLGRTSTKTLTGIDQNKLNEQELKNIQLEVDQIETEIEQIEAEQLIQNTDILQNTANIAVNAQGIAANLLSIEALNAEQVVQNTNINLNSIDIDDLEQRADAFDIQQDTQNTNILANTNAINSLGTRTTALETQTNSLQSQLNGFQSDTLQDLNDITADLTALQTTVTQNKTAADNEFSDIQQQLVDLDIRITQNRQDIDQNFLYIEIIMTSIYYNKNEIDNQFLQLRGTWTGSISELKDGLDTLIAGLTVRMGQAEADITGLQTTATSLQNQINSNDGDISTLQTTATSLQNQINSNDGDISSLQSQINSNDGDISTLQTKSQHLTSNTSNTFISSNLDVGQTLAVTGTVPENPAIIIRDAANANAIMTMDALSLSAQGNPIIQSNDSSLLAQNTDQSGVLVLSSTGPKRCGVRIAKDFIDEFADTCNFKNSDGNTMTSISKATPTSSILSHNTIIRTDYVRYRSPIAGYAVSGVPNGSYDQIVALISSTVSFVPNNTIDFFIILPGFRIEAYSGAGYTGNQNIYSNVDGNFPLNVSAIDPDTMSSIKVFYKSMDGSESEILILL